MAANAAPENAEYVGDIMWRAVRCPDAVVPMEVASYFTDAVNWAVSAKATTSAGDGTLFSPAMICDRAQIVTFLQRAFGE